MAIRRIKSKRKNPARARSLVANPRKRKRRNPKHYGHKAKHKSKNPRKRAKRNPGDLGAIFSSENVQMVVNVGIGAAAGLVVAYYGDRLMFKESADGKTYTPTKFAQENPTVAAIAPHAVVAVLGLAGGVMLQNKTAKGIAYGAAAAGVTGAVLAGVGPSIVKMLEGKSDTPAPVAKPDGTTPGYLPQLNIYGMGGAFGHGHGNSAGAYLSYDSAGQPSGYFIEGSRTMAGFSGF